MRTQLILGLAIAMMATVACTKKNEDNNNGGYAGVGPAPGPYGPGYPGQGNGGWTQYQNQFQLKHLQIGAATIETVRSGQNNARQLEELEKVRFTCMDSTREARNSSLDGVILVDGAEVMLAGNISSRRSPVLITCNDQNRRDDRRNARPGFGNEQRLTVGQTANAFVNSTRNQFRQEMLMGVQVTCVNGPQDLINTGRVGLLLTRGSKIIVSRDGDRGLFDGRYNGRYSTRGNQPPLNNGQRGGNIDAVISCE